MNERIEKLMDETDSWCDKNFPSDWLNRVDEFLPLWNEKFAELIVRECAMIVEGFEITQEVALDEYVDYEASNVLKEHFGVE